MVKVYYENSAGVVIDFASAVYKMHKATDLLNYKWEYTSSEFINKIESFEMKYAEKSVTVTIKGKTREEYTNALLQIGNAFERDVKTLTPGKLHIGEYYLKCYFISAEQSQFDWHRTKCEKTYGLIAESGQWIRETEYNMSTMTTEEVLTEYLEYPYDYPYDYDSMAVVRKINNKSVVGAEFKMLIYGPCENPGIYIGNHLYQINTTLMTGEYILIDSEDRSVVKIKVDGEKVSCFNDRNRDYYIFKQIDPGVQTVICNGVFGIKITVLELRSEPEWWI